MKNQSYTLITGASEGFGRSLAIECAGRGMNLILVALPGPELEEITDFIRENYEVDLLAFGKDLTSEQECFSLHREVEDRGIKVNMLINNAGLGNTNFFSEIRPEFYDRQLKLNVVATTLLTRLFLGQLMSHERSYVLNVGSLASYFYLPKKIVYGGTKAYIFYFSKTLHKELKQHGVRVSVVCPGSMNTNVRVTFQNRCSTWFTRNSAMNPEEVAPIALNGLLKGRKVIIPGKMNQLFKFIDYILPEPVKNMITRNQMANQKLPPFMENV